MTRRRRIRAAAVIAVALALGLGALGGLALDGLTRAASAGDAPVTARRIPRSVLGGNGAVVDDLGVVVAGMRLESALSLSGAGLGGLSGLWVGEDGAEMVAVSDAGPVWRGRLVRDDEGRLSGVTGFARMDPFGDETSKRELDAEELAAVPGGGWLVSFERHHRLLLLAPGIVGGRGPVKVPTPADLADAPSNGGVEAMTVLSDGRVLMIEEGEDDDRPLRRAWLSVPITTSAGVGAIGGAADWVGLTYDRAPGYRPTAATTTPEGDVLVLERHYSPLAGPGARVVHVAATAITPGGVVRGRELARLTPPSPVDNFEGIAARRRSGPGGDGRLEVLILSDDNFNPLQSTLLVQLSAP